MADGEVSKVAKENKKITVKHGVIKNLDMPGITLTCSLSQGTADSTKFALYFR